MYNILVDNTTILKQHYVTTTMRYDTTFTTAKSNFSDENVWYLSCFCF